MRETIGGGARIPPAASRVIMARWMRMAVRQAAANGTLAVVFLLYGATRTDRALSDLPGVTETLDMAGWSLRSPRGRLVMGGALQRLLVEYERRAGVAATTRARGHYFNDTPAGRAENKFTFASLAELLRPIVSVLVEGPLLTVSKFVPACPQETIAGIA